MGVSNQYLKKKMLKKIFGPKRDEVENLDFIMRNCMT
jgi:hypothetical protein